MFPTLLVSPHHCLIHWTVALSQLLRFCCNIFRDLMAKQQLTQIQIKIIKLDYAEVVWEVFVAALILFFFLSLNHYWNLLQLLWIQSDYSCFSHQSSLISHIHTHKHITSSSSLNDKISCSPASYKATHDAFSSFCSAPSVLKLLQNTQATKSTWLRFGRGYLPGWKKPSATENGTETTVSFSPQRGVMEIQTWLNTCSVSCLRFYQVFLVSSVNC